MGRQVVVVDLLDDDDYRVIREKVMDGVDRYMERDTDGENFYKAAVWLVIEDRMGRQAGRFVFFFFSFSEIASRVFGAERGYQAQGIAGERMGLLMVGRETCGVV